MSTIDDVRTAIDGALTAVSELDPEVAALNQRPGGVVEYKLTEARLWAAQLRTTTVGGLGSVDTGGTVAPADTSTDDPDPGPVKPDQPNANAGTGETTTTEPDPATAPVTLAASPTVTPEPDATAATATADESPDADPTKDVPVGKKPLAHVPTPGQLLGGPPPWHTRPPVQQNRGPFVIPDTNVTRYP